MSLKKKDQDAIAKLYMENYVDYEGESAWIPSGGKQTNDSPLSTEEIVDIYQELENIVEEKVDRLSTILGNSNNLFYKHLTEAMKILYPHMKIENPRDEY